MGESNFGTWIFAFLIVAVIFGWGGIGGGNAAAAGYATAQDINNAIAAQTSALNQQSLLLSSANNNYETARLIDNQSMLVLNQNNTNLVNAIQGFNTVNQNIASGFNSVNQSIADLGYKMENCCCSIKTLIKDNQIADLTNQLNQANNIAVNQAQSEYLLGQMGKWVANAPAAAAYSVK